jgi:hypothetical protein
MFLTMPQVDMPLEKLKEYAGIHPRPADFDEFWDRSLAEMRSIDPAAGLEAAVGGGMLPIAIASAKGSPLAKHSLESFAELLELFA